MRDYTNTPRPEIENHWHIKELIEAQERRAADRTYHQDRVKALEERNQLIKDAKVKDTMSFYCETCREDFIGESVKEVEIDWSNTAQSIAFYRTKCFQGHWCMRYITDKLHDPYWQKSLRVERDRGIHHDALLQSFESGYNLLYGKK